MTQEFVIAELEKTNMWGTCRPPIEGMTEMIMNNRNRLGIVGLQILERSDDLLLTTASPTFHVGIVLGGWAPDVTWENQENGEVVVRLAWFE